MCLSGKDEIMFRTDEDYRRAINCLVLAAYKTESSILAYAFMSTHVHLCIKTSNPYKVMTIYRYAYTRYFNNKYHRRGKLGDRYLLRIAQSSAPWGKRNCIRISLFFYPVLFQEGYGER